MPSLGLDWAFDDQDQVAGIAYLEAIVAAMTWRDWQDNPRRTFQGFRSAAGEAVVLKDNLFVERVLPAAILRDLTDEEVAVYRVPFLEPAAVPKLFINAESGSILIRSQREFCRTWPNQAEVTVPGRHFIQEDSPDQIGIAVAEFVDRIRQPGISLR